MLVEEQQLMKVVENIRMVVPDYKMEALTDYCYDSKDEILMAIGH